jgi:ribosomal protein S13
MENKVYQYYKELPNWAKGVTVVGTLGLIGVIGFTINKKIKDKKAFDEANRQSRLAEQELEDLRNRGINITHSLSEFEGYSQAIIEAINGCGTDEETIYNVFRQMKNDADIRQLIATFGIRFYRPCEISQPISYTRWLFDDQAFGGALSTYLYYDLSDSEIEEINDILKNNRVNWTF